MVAGRARSCSGFILVLTRNAELVTQSSVRIVKGCIVQRVMPCAAPGNHERCDKVLDKLTQDIDIYVDSVLADES